MSNSIKLSMVGKVDREKNEYFFTRPNLPISIDLSKCVIFVHTWEQDGQFGADLVIKNYTGKKPDSGKPENGVESDEADEA